MMVGIPLALGSYWALLTIIPGVLIFVARITDEEKVLREDLDGYDAYTAEGALPPGARGVVTNENLCPQRITSSIGHDARSYSW